MLTVTEVPVAYPAPPSIDTPPTVGKELSSVIVSELDPLTFNAASLTRTYTVLVPFALPSVIPADCGEPVHDCHVAPANTALSDTW
jgi:hypothetical protein